MKASLQAILGFVLAVLFLGACNNGWSPPPPEKWCEPEAARQILLDEYAYVQGNPVQLDGREYNFEGQTITFADVQPIMRLNCWPCHRPAGNAPFPLQSYAQVMRKVSTIKEVLAQKVMPPWMGDTQYSTILDAPAITMEERAKIIWWIEHGAEEGPAINETAMPSLALRDSADRYVAVAEPHVITSNTDSYQCFVLDPQLEEDVYVNAISFQSTNPFAIHHIMMYIDTAGTLDSLPADWDCMKDDLVNNLVPIDSWSKGQRLIRYSEDYAYHFPKRTKILLQIHYGDEGNQGKLEQSTVGLYYKKTAPARPIQWAILNNLDIAIPANQVKVETIAYPVTADMAILGLVPHLHFIGRVVECYAMTADCKKINLLKIPDWDYLWQARFMFPHPILVPKGSTIYMNVLYDNTHANPKQPNEPIIDIHYDNFSNQEMMVNCIFYTDYQAGDEAKTVGELVR